MGNDTPQNQLKNEIAIADILHRLNNPLGISRQLIAFIEHDYAEVLAEHPGMAKDLADVKSSIEKVTSILLEYREILSSQQRIAISLKSLIESVVSDLEVPESIELSVDIDESTSDVLAGYQLENVFRNLIINSIEAMPDGGNIHIYADVDEENRTVEIVIADTGPGVPSTIRESLFKNPVSTKAEGRGLGLYWAERYISSSGGNLQVSSTSAEGTTFSLTLPLA